MLENLIQNIRQSAAKININNYIYYVQRLWSRSQMISKRWNSHTRIWYNLNCIAIYRNNNINVVIITILNLIAFDLVAVQPLDNKSGMLNYQIEVAWYSDVSRITLLIAGTSRNGQSAANY